MRTFFLHNLLFFLIACSGPETPPSASSEPPLLYVPDDLEATLWAESPQFFNPTNMDVDARGRIWLTEAVNYRDFNNNDGHLRHEAGDRVMILEDTDGDGRSDSSKVFVQDKDLRSPLGIAVIGNKVVVSCAPSIIIYTDEDGDDQPDHKEVFLTGFGGLDHDHSLHSTVAGPDGKWYFNTGNAGPHVVTDQAGWTLRSGSAYYGGTPYNTDNTPNMKSDDGRVWVGGLALRINPDGTGLEVLAHNFRNSYEVTVDSYGNLWQNDNDDQVASCRTTWLMEGSNAGYFSPDGERFWQAERRPGQSIQTAHWHQDDPGVLPAGDVYGAGSPTGMLINESDALGQQHRGLLLNVDAGRNIIFGYHPEPTGAGYRLERTNFIASIDDDNEGYTWNDIDDDHRKWFRPSDAVIGTDGAIYVADWYDPVVGGHQMNDKEGYGRIYRIAPKDKELTVPTYDLTTTAGQLAALCSPAINVRNRGFVALQAQGAAVLPDVQSLLAADNPYHRARAVWLMAQLGEAGRQAVEAVLKHQDPQLRLTAFRALRGEQSGQPEQWLTYAEPLASDPSPAVRREVALSLRDVPLAQSQSILLTLVDGYDGQDPWYREALGIALTDKAEAFYPVLLAHFGQPQPTEWSQPLANVVWQTHPEAATAALRERATAPPLSEAERQQALVALAFVPTQPAAQAMLALANDASPKMQEQAQWWLQSRKTNDWRAYLEDWESPATNVPEAHPELLPLKAHVLDTTATPEQRRAAATQLAETRVGRLHLLQLAVEDALPDTLRRAISPLVLRGDDRYFNALATHYFPSSDTPADYTVEAVAKLSPDGEAGKPLFYANCAPCHKIGQAGSELGPELTNIHTKYDKNGLLEAIAYPSHAIAFGSEPWLITTPEGGAAYGILLSDGPVVTLVDAYSQRYMMEADRVASKTRLPQSLMPAPQYLELSEQDVANIAAFLLQTEDRLALSLR